MRIAIFTDTYVPQMNGVVAYLSDAIRLLSRDNDVVVFAPGVGRQLRVEQAGRLRTYWVPSSPFPFYEGYRIASINYKRVSNLLRKEKPDVVHAHAPVNLGLQGIIAARRKKIPVVVTYHTHFPDYVPHLLNGKLPKVLADISGYTVKRMIRHVFGMADVVTAPTNELAAELRSYGLTNVEYLPNGIDFSKLRCSPREAAAFRKSHGLTGKKVVLYLGRISFEKRLDALLEAFRRIEKPGRVLVVAGSGPYLKDFRDFAKTRGLKNAVFAGFVKRPAAAYCCADVFASASDSETFGLTFVEAMHAGVPAIGVRRLGAKEIIRHGRNGLLVEPGDTAGLAKAMERLLDDERLRERLGEAGKKTAKRYSIENSVGETLRIYRRLVRKA
ncbi:MAG: glycosyltransferase family 1 protein [Candidatus Micrarchaeota archaeon]